MESILNQILMDMLTDPGADVHCAYRRGEHTSHITFEVGSEEEVIEMIAGATLDDFMSALGFNGEDGNNGVT